MGKLSPEIVNGLKERGVNLTDAEVTSINTVLRNTPQELSMEDLDQAVGGIEWEKVGIGSAVAIVALCAILGADRAQSMIRKKDGQTYSDNMYSIKLWNAAKEKFGKKADA
ncbi:MAG: hypothetical protein ACI4PR_04215 [Acutalibacteraceae bacterium]